MPAGFRRHLVGKTVGGVCYTAVTLCQWVKDHMDIFLNELVEFCLNNTVNLHPLTPHIMRSYTHKMANVDGAWV